MKRREECITWAGVATPYMATALVNLGILYTEQGKYAEAKDSLVKAKHIQDEVLGCNHPDVAIRLHAEANLHAKSGCADAARAAQEKANAIQDPCEAG